MEDLLNDCGFDKSQELPDLSQFEDLEDLLTPQQETGDDVFADNAGGRKSPTSQTQPDAESDAISDVMSGLSLEENADDKINKKKRESAE